MFHHYARDKHSITAFNISRVLPLRQRTQYYDVQQPLRFTARPTINTVLRRSTYPTFNRYADEHSITAFNIYVLPLRRRTQYYGVQHILRFTATPMNTVFRHSTIPYVLPLRRRTQFTTFNISFTFHRYARYEHSITSFNISYVLPLRRRTQYYGVQQYPTSYRYADEHSITAFNNTLRFTTTPTNTVL